MYNEQGNYYSIRIFKIQNDNFRMRVTRCFPLYVLGYTETWRTTFTTPQIASSLRINFVCRYGIVSTIRKSLAKCSKFDEIRFDKLSFTELYPSENENNTRLTASIYVT